MSDLKYYWKSKEKLRQKHPILDFKLNIKDITKKTGVRRQIIPLHRQVNPTGEVSNFLLEDYESMLTLISAKEVKL